MKKENSGNVSIFDSVTSGIWEGLKAVIAWAVIIYVLLFFIVGGEFAFSIKWENVTDLLNAIRNYMR